MPAAYSKYKELAANVDREEGCVLSLVTPEEE
jgi:hypothetical protein